MWKLIALVLIASVVLSTISGVIGFFVDLIRFGKKQYEEEIIPSAEAYAERLESIEKEVSKSGNIDGSHHPTVSDIRL